MAERGATPTLSARRLRAIRALQSFTSPLAPDDYLEIVNPLWSTRELRGRVVRVERACENASTVTIKPGWQWPGHLPGQYLRIGVEVNGIHHWRAYSLTSEPGREDGTISVTVKRVEGGVVSPYLHAGIRAGAIVRLGGVEGTFVLPDPTPERLLFVSAGSGITPIISMLRSLDGASAAPDVVHLHSARALEEVPFAAELSALSRRRASYRPHLRLTGAAARLAPAELDELCPDWRERETFLCGPSGLLDAFSAHVREHGDERRLHLERFTPEAPLADAERGCGGMVDFCVSGAAAAADGETSILVAGEAAGIELPHGCRMGICHSCVGRLRAGQVRDLRTGRVHGQRGEEVQTCINAPEGAIEIEL